MVKLVPKLKTKNLLKSVLVDMKPNTRINGWNDTKQAEIPYFQRGPSS